MSSYGWVANAFGGPIGFIDIATDPTLRILTFEARAACRTPVNSSIAGGRYSPSRTSNLTPPYLRIIDNAHAKFAYSNVYLRLFHTYVMQGGWIAPRRRYSRWMMAAAASKESLHPHSSSTSLKSEHYVNTSMDPSDVPVCKKHTDAHPTKLVTTEVGGVDIVILGVFASRHDRRGSNQGCGSSDSDSSASSTTVLRHPASSSSSAGGGLLLIFAVPVRLAPPQGAFRLGRSFKQQADI